MSRTNHIKSSGRIGEHKKGIKKVNEDYKSRKEGLGRKANIKLSVKLIFVYTDHFSLSTKIEVENCEHGKLI